MNLLLPINYGKKFGMKYALNRSSIVLFNPFLKVRSSDQRAREQVNGDRGGNEGRCERQAALAPDSPGHRVAQTAARPAADDIPSGSNSDFGVGDVTQSFFFSPQKPTAGGWIWGAGPVVLLPLSRASESDIFGAGEWGGGVTGVALRQTETGWTYGALANHIWDIGGDTDISNTYLQPFIAHTIPTAWTVALNSESTYDWEAEEWSIPINLMLSKVVHFGK